MPATGFSIGFERVIEILGKNRGREGRADRIAVLFDDSKEGLGRACGAPRSSVAQGRLVALERRREAREPSARPWRSKATTGRPWSGSTGW